MKSLSKRIEDAKSLTGVAKLLEDYTSTKIEFTTRKLLEIVKDEQHHDYKAVLDGLHDLLEDLEKQKGVYSKFVGRIRAEDET